MDDNSLKSLTLKSLILAMQIPRKEITLRRYINEQRNVLNEIEKILDKIQTDSEIG